MESGETGSIQVEWGQTHFRLLAAFVMVFRVQPGVPVA